MKSLYESLAIPLGVTELQPMSNYFYCKFYSYFYLFIYLYFSSLFNSMFLTFWSSLNLNQLLIQQPKCFHNIKLHFIIKPKSKPKVYIRVCYFGTYILLARYIRNIYVQQTENNGSCEMKHNTCSWNIIISNHKLLTNRSSSIKVYISSFLLFSFIHLLYVACYTDICAFNIILLHFLYEKFQVDQLNLELIK